jgi:hypothetical protein
MRTLRLLGPALLLAALASAASAADVVGKWTGKLVMEGSSKAMDAARAQAGNMKVALVLRADKTFSATQTGPTGKHTSEGVWSLSGKKLTLTARKRDGKAVQGPGVPRRAWPRARPTKRPRRPSRR